MAAFETAAAAALAALAAAVDARAAQAAAAIEAARTALATPGADEDAVLLAAQAQLYAALSKVRHTMLRCAAAQTRMLWCWRRRCSCTLLGSAVLRRERQRCAAYGQFCEC